MLVGVDQPFLVDGLEYGSAASLERRLLLRTRPGRMSEAAETYLVLPAYLVEESSQVVARLSASSVVDPYDPEAVHRMLPFYLLISSYSPIILGTSYRLRQ